MFWFSAPRASLIDWYRMVNQPSIEDMEDFFAKGKNLFLIYTKFYYS